MADDPRTYLLDRFATDATTLRSRAEMLAGRPAPEHGPDAQASRAMADACDEVIAMLNGITAETDADLLDALDTLGPKLHSEAEDQSNAFVRSVFAGAAARIEDIVNKTRALLIDGDEHDGDVNDDFDEADLDDDDVDDDDDIDDRDADDEFTGDDDKRRTHEDR